MNPYSTDKPRFHVLVGNTEDVDQYVAKLRFEAGARIAIRVLRGENMKSADGVYNELAAALQFPLYFGRNWDALDECLADLEWLPSDAYLLVFADAPLVLESAGDRDAETFLKLLFRACNDWAEGSSLGGGLERKPRAFHVVFHAGAAEADRFLHRVEAATGCPVAKMAASEQK
jgi:RNAse (barnase) inhibitor barstar